MNYGTPCLKFGFINIWISDQHYPCPTWVLNDISNTIKIKDIQEELNNSISGSTMKIYTRGLYMDGRYLWCLIIDSRYIICDMPVKNRQGFYGGIL